MPVSWLYSVTEPRIDARLQNTPPTNSLQPAGVLSIVELSCCLLQLLLCAASSPGPARLQQTRSKIGGARREAGDVPTMALAGLARPCVCSARRMGGPPVAESAPQLGTIMAEISHRCVVHGDPGQQCRRPCLPIRRRLAPPYACAGRCDERFVESICATPTCHERGDLRRAPRQLRTCPLDGSCHKLEVLCNWKRTP